MDKLSTEEKAKRYDEALEMAKKLIENEETNVPVFYVNNIKDIFPELKESIDERIRKVIKQVLSESTTEKDECYLDNGVTQQEVFAWLERQGEQPKKHDVCDNCDQQGCCVSPCPMKLVGEHGEQKPTEWSDEDETALGDALWCCKQAANIAKDENDMGNVWYAETWLKTIKYRVQPKQEWSEEDRRMLIGLIDELDAIMNKATSNEISVYSKYTNWLKSIRPQNTWKPSDEQMGVIEAVINNRSFQRRHLDSLYADLKKLREE